MGGKKKVLAKRDRGQRKDFFLRGFSAFGFACIKNL